jgi:lysophospholipase L1-like esterase/nitrate reductase NapAB chaperone NapD
VKKSKLLFYVFLFSILIQTNIKAQTRVVCIGNSLTVGTGTTNPSTKSWPAQLRTMLGTGYSVLNCGFSGSEMTKSGNSPYWNKTQFTTARNSDPQILIISLGTDDASTANLPYIGDYATDYVAMIDSFRVNAKNPIVYICYPAPDFGNTAQNTVIHDQIIPLIDQVHGLRESTVIDFYNPLLSYGSLFPDHLNPNDQGAANMARIVYNAMNQVSAIATGNIYEIVSKTTNKPLEVFNSSLANNGNVDIWSDTKSDSQRWRVDSVGVNLYTITNVANGKLLHIANSTPANSVNVDQYVNTLNNFVRWGITKQDNGFFTLQTAANTTFVLNVTGSGSNDGINVALSKSAGTDAQSWSFILQTPQDIAPTAPIADQIFTAWKAKYYDTNRTGNEVIAREGFWGVAEMMEIVDDAYEVTGNSKYPTLFSTMYNQFLIQQGSDWMWNSYNDDITWMVIACTRASILSGNTVFLTKAKDQFDKMWARANHDGSWLTWNQGTAGTNSCINGPAMVACCYLAQATGDTTYYDKAIALYTWSRNKLFMTATGKVNDNYNNGVVGDWSSTYNQGTYLGAAMMLYNYTKDPTYLTEAQRIAQYTKITMSASGVINNESGPDLNGFKGIFMRYARRYVVDANKTDFIPWLQLNANVAYNNRNSENLISTNWGTRTAETITLTTDSTLKIIPAFAASTAVSLLMNCPYSTTLLKNAYNTIEAENFDYLKGVSVEACPEGTLDLAVIKSGFYSGYNNIDFGFKGSESAIFRLACTMAGNTIEIHLGSPTGKLIGTATTTNTGNLTTYADITCPVTNVKGLMNVYLVYKGTGTICKINNFKFVEAAVAGETHGLLGSYFNGSNFGLQVIQRIDSVINFNWAEFSPDAVVNVNNFSARWTGKILPLYTGTYTFTITSANARRVWIDNQLIVDQWINDVDVPYSGTIDLIAGQKYDIKVEYNNLIGNADIRLEWQSDLQVRQVIPSSQLFMPDEVPSAIIDTRAPVEGLIVYPNPVTTQISINSGSVEAAQVSVFDIQGKLVIQSNQKFSGTKTFDVSQLPKGVYFVTVVSTNGVKLTHKFIK